MIIDSHAHLKHGNVDRTEYTAQQIVESLDGSGVDKSVVFGICETAWDAVERAKQACEQFPDRLIPYAYALPSVERAILPVLEEAVTSLGFKGIKLHAGECTLAEYVSDPVLALAAKLDVPCLIDFTGRDRDLERMARTFPDTKLIVAHLGRYLCTDDALIDRFIALAEQHENVYLDISGVVMLGSIRKAVGRVGKERVLWGSDGPYPDPGLADYISTDIRKVRAAGLNQDELDAVLGNNIARLWKL
ncbi:MAG: amidohydrolase family protein [bacterium]|nr:amidohydrolase family protein [bacterium]